MFLPFVCNYLMYTSFTKICTSGKRLATINLAINLVTILLKLALFPGLPSKWQLQVSSSLNATSVLDRIRSSCSQMFFKMGSLKNFANFTGKHLCHSPFKETKTKTFPMKFTKFLRTTFYIAPLVAASVGLKSWFPSVTCLKYQ